MKERLYLGVGRACITPPIGTELYGYAPGVISTSVHDDLSVTALFFSFGEKRALLLSVTVASIQTELSDSIRARIESLYGIPRDACILHCTHTHSAPNLTGSVGWGEIDRGYYEEIFLPRLLSALGDAVRSPVRVRMGIATGQSLIGINRRELTEDNRVRLGQNPWGTFDPTMTVLSFINGEGKPIANVVHYGMHGTCAGKNLEISRDWSGVMTDALEKQSGAVTCFVNGSEGDVGPRLTNGETTGEGDVSYVDIHGAWAANDAVRIWKTIRAYREASLDFFEGTVALPLEKRIDYEAAKAGCKMYTDTVNLAGAKAHYYREQVRLYEEGYIDRSARTVSQTVVRIGDVAIVSTPFELFSEIGMRIARHSPIPHTLTLSNANGSEGYLVTQDQLCRGGYETDMFKHGYLQPYADDADWHMLTDTLKNIEKVKEE